jgi:hypothetical protein
MVALQGSRGKGEYKRAAGQERLQSMSALLSQTALKASPPPPTCVVILIIHNVQVGQLFPVLLLIAHAAAVAAAGVDF